MAGNQTLASMTAASALTGAELLYGNQSGSDVKITATQIQTFAGGGLTIGTSTITSGTNTRILYDNAGVVGEYTLSGTGTVVAMATSPSFTTPTLGVAVGTSLALGGATLGSNALAITGSVAGSVQIWSGSVSTALSTLTGGSDGFRTSAANATQLAGENTTSSGASAGGMVGMYSNDGAAMASGDRLGGFRMGGSSSASALRNSAGLFAFADQLWVDASAYGSRLELQTTTNNAIALSTKAILSNAGLFALGATLANTVPAIKPSSTTLAVRLADDSGDAPISALTSTFSGTGTAITTAGNLLFSDGTKIIQFGGTSSSNCGVGRVTGTNSTASVLADGSNYAGFSATQLGAGFITCSAGGVIGFNNTSAQGGNLGTADAGFSRTGSAAVALGNGSNADATGTLALGALRINATPTAVVQVTAMTINSGADSASNIGHRISINMNGTTYWIPASTTAF